MTNVEKAAKENMKQLKRYDGVGGLVLLESKDGETRFTCNPDYPVVALGYIANAMAIVAEEAGLTPSAALIAVSSMFAAATPVIENDNDFQEVILTLLEKISVPDEQIDVLLGKNKK